MKKLKNRIELIPELAFGKDNFTGNPCPSKRAFDLLEKKGIKFIDKEIKKIIQYRLKMFGNRQNRTHGFFGCQRFIDWENLNVFVLDDIVDYMWPNDLEYANDALLVPENYLLDLDINFSKEAKESKNSFKKRYFTCIYKNHDFEYFPNFME